METKFKKCLYCDKMTHEPHFQSGCCERGMCEECFQGLQGTDEQLQLDYIDEQTLEEASKGFLKQIEEAESEGFDYLCFNCIKN